MKILYTITSITLGGAETQLMRLVEYLAKEKKHEIMVVSLIDPTYELFIDQLKEQKVNYISLQMTRGKVSLSGWYKFIKIVREFNPDVVHSHMIHANFLCRFSRIFVHMSRLINTIHGEEELLGNRKIVYRATDWLSDLTTCIGKVIAKQAETSKAVSRKKIKLVYNALDTEKYQFNLKERQKIRTQLGIDQNEFTWIIVGRLDPVKDHMNLFSAMGILEHQSCTPFLLIAGDGENREVLQNKISNHESLISKIKFLGRRNDIERILSAADAFVLSSVHEGLPLVLQEAAVQGLPMVATDVGGCREIVVNGKNGFLVPKKDSEKLATAMLKVMNLSEDERNKFGRYTIEFARKNFDIKNIMDKWLDLYKSN